MIDLAQLRREPDTVKAALARRGVSLATVDEILALDLDCFKGPRHCEPR